MLVRFWGVRGSIACPGRDTLRYGGNTSCVEVRCGEHLFIFDAGTGLRNLGKALAMDSAPVDADIFCSHTHFDHICGIAFFAPCFDKANRLRFWGAAPLSGGACIEDILIRSLSEPFLPDLPAAMSAKISFQDFQTNETLTPRPGVVVHTGALNHPGHATGYRLEWGGRAVAYITDTEHRADGLDPTVLALINGVDLMIYDATYTDAEYCYHIGWGHSTWEEAVRLAEAASVKQVALFHHDPSHTDDMMDQLAAQIASTHDDVVLAREGMAFSL